MRLWVEAEALLDAGDLACGRRRLCEAYSLASELDSDPWPKWADDLYRVGPAGDGWPRVPLIGEPQASITVSGIVAALADRNFAVVDGFATAEAAAQVRETCSELFETGEMHPPAQR